MQVSGLGDPRCPASHFLELHTWRHGQDDRVGKKVRALVQVLGDLAHMRLDFAALEAHQLVALLAEARDVRNLGNLAPGHREGVDLVRALAELHGGEVVRATLWLPRGHRTPPRTTCESGWPR